MPLKEKIAYALGLIILLVGAFAGRDFSDTADIIDGVLMIVLFVGLFLIMTYLNKQTFGDRKPNKTQE
jgi:hypothetical protein